MEDCEVLNASDPLPPPTSTMHNNTPAKKYTIESEELTKRSEGKDSFDHDAFDGNTLEFGGHVFRPWSFVRAAKYLGRPLALMFSIAYIALLLPQGSARTGIDDYFALKCLFYLVNASYCVTLIPGTLHMMTGTLHVGFSLFIIVLFVIANITMFVTLQATRSLYPVIIIVVPACMWVVFAVPTHTWWWYRKDPQSPLRERPFLFAYAKTIIAPTTYFFLCFGFSTFFVVLQDNVIYQIFALIVFQTVGTIFYKGIVVSWCTKTLETQSMKTRVATTSAVFYEFLGELFLSFSFPNVQHWSVLIFACVYEVLLFIFQLRLAAKIPKEPVMSHRNPDASFKASKSQHGTTKKVVPLDVEANTAFGLHDLPTDITKPGARTARLKSTNPKTVRAMCKGGGVLLCELLAGITFVSMYSLFCWGPAKDAFLAGTGSCGTVEALVPISFTLFGMSLHIAAYLVVYKRVRKYYDINPLQLSVTILAENRTHLLGVLAVSMAILCVWFWKSGHVFHFLSVAEYS